MVELRNQFFAYHETMAAILEVMFTDLLLLLAEPERSIQDERLRDFDRGFMPSL